MADWINSHNKTLNFLSLPYLLLFIIVEKCRVFITNFGGLAVRILDPVYTKTSEKRTL